jgi:hypothetical protein
MVNLVELFKTSGATNILLQLTGIFIFLLILGFIGYKFFKKKYLYTFSFTIIQHSGRLQLKKARLLLSKTKVKKFELDGYAGKLLDVKDPNGYVNDLPTRFVAWDGQGNLAYVENIDDHTITKHDRLKVGRKDYKEVALLPVERELQALAVIESTKKYDRVDTVQKTILFSMVGLIFVVVIGLYALGKVNLDTAEKVSGASSSHGESIRSLERTAGIIESNNQIQSAILGYLTDGNFTIELAAE